MEGANEAARRAVNCIIDREGAFVAPCQLWQLHEPLLLAPMRLMDEARFKMGLPWQSPNFGHAMRSDVTKAAHDIEKEATNLVADAKEELHKVEESVKKIEGAAKNLVDKIV